MTEVPVNPALEHRDGAVRDFHHFFNVRGNHQYRNPRFFQLMNDIVDVSAGARVDSAGGLIQDNDLGQRGKCPGNNHLLLVSAGKAADQVHQGNDLCPEIIHIFL